MTESKYKELSDGTATGRAGRKKIVDVPTNATWALWLPGTTSGGKEKEMDVELFNFNGSTSRNSVSERDCLTPSGCGNMNKIHSYHRISSRPSRIFDITAKSHSYGCYPMFPSYRTFTFTIQTRLSEASADTASTDISISPRATGLIGNSAEADT